MFFFVDVERQKWNANDFDVLVSLAIALCVRKRKNALLYLRKELKTVNSLDFCTWLTGSCFVLLSSEKYRYIVWSGKTVKCDFLLSQP